MKKIIFLFFITYIFALTPVTIQLNWKNQFEFAGFYVAKEKGFYKNEGLDVTIKELDKNINVVDEVLKGKVNFAIGYSNLIYDIANGKKIKVLLAIFKSSPYVLFTTKNIKNIQDFKNKRIMLDVNTKFKANFLAMLRLGKIDLLKDLKIIPTTFDIHSLIEGKTDIFPGFISNEKYILDKKKFPYNIFDPKDYGFDFYDDLIFTSLNFYKNHLKIVFKFINATIKGYIYAYNHIDEAIDIILKKYNTQNKSKEFLKYEANVLKNYIFFNKKTIFDLEYSKAKRIENIYKALGLIKKDINISKYMVENIYKTEIEEFSKTHKVLKMCVNPDWEPLSFVINKKPFGILIDLTDAIFNKLHIKYKYVLTSSWSKSLEYLKDGKCDFIPGVIENKNRDKYFNFTKTILKLPLAIITNKKLSYIKSINDLKDKVFVRKKGSALIYYMKTHYPQIKIKEVDSYYKQFKLVDKNSKYFTIATIPVFIYFKHKYDLNNIKIAKKLNKTYNLKIATNKNKELLADILNYGINNFSKDKKEFILEKWKYPLEKLEAEKMKHKYKTLKIVFIIVLFVVFIILLIFIINYFFDKHYHKKLFKEIEKAKKEIKEKEKMLYLQAKQAQMGEMINMIAHQWRQPLNAISANLIKLELKLQMGELSNKELEKNLKFLQEQIQKLSQIINDFMNFSKENKKINKFKIIDAIDEVLEIIEPQLKNHNINLEVNIDKNLEITTYKRELQHILINLLTNARDVLDEKNLENKNIKIKVYTEKENNKVKIIVEDNAGGISKNIQDKIFNPYFTTKEKGTGLGLYMSKMIANKILHGNLYFETNGKTKFIIEIPLNVNE